MRDLTAWVNSKIVTGKFGLSPAQHLADALELPVLAPTSEVTIPAVAGDPKLETGGEWRRFDPRPDDHLNKDVRSPLKAYSAIITIF